MSEERNAGGSEAAVVPTCTMVMSSGPLPPIAAMAEASIVADDTELANEKASPPARVAISWCRSSNVADLCWVSATGSRCSYERVFCLCRFQGKG